jgi:hypothetical protein
MNITCIEGDFTTTNLPALMDHLETKGHTLYRVEKIGVVTIVSIERKTV